VGDGQVEFIAELGEAELSGKASVNADKFLKALSSCKFECKVFLKEDRLEIKSGRRRFKLQTIDPDSYPSFYNSKDREKLDIKAHDFIANIKKLAPIAATNDVRHYLNGVYIGDDFAATNGHRLCSVKADLPCKSIIPTESIKKFPSDVDGEVYIDSNNVTIKSDKLTLKSRLIDATYPDYTKVAQIPNKAVTVDCDAFQSAIKDALIGSGDDGSINLIVTNKLITVVSSAGKSEAKIDIECESDSEFEMAFNGKYLIDALSFYSDSVLLGFSDSQLVIDGDVSSVVMRVRL
jgi:DNA polymerase-3 subunit beta